MKPQAIVFDLDGTLVDTEPVGYRSWQLAARELNYPLPEGFVDSIIGQNAKLIRQRLHEVSPEGMDPEAYFDKARETYHRLLHTEPVPLKPGAEGILRWLAGLGIPLAVCTSTNRYEAEHKLGSNGLLDYFEGLVCGDEVEHGKPHPEPFLKAAELLGMPPEGCIAIEDSPNGLRAAHAAGMRVILIPDLAHIVEEVEALCWQRVDHLDAARACLWRELEQWQDADEASSAR
ncbi:MAG: haloacid dehalogenase/epoxide hydrolase family protein [Puniceicoccaceae bacterium 5H]|nr:MAG: haloacid dehalogenase/epoxide hydrolase family protein [Puniceicoccaceae bacterium 5H]